MRICICLGLLLAVCCTSAAAGRVEFSECLGAHGERVFSDRADCGDSTIRQWSLPIPVVAATPPPVNADPPVTRRNSRGGRRASAAKPADSYLCTTATQSWYQHQPCRGGGAGKGEKREPVRQSRVSRQQACREIARPAALLRRGSQRDERTGPYDRAAGRDPCR